MCVLLAMPLSDVLSENFAGHVCRTMTLQLTLRLIVDRPIVCVGAASTEIRVCPLQRSRLLERNNWVILLIPRVKLRADLPRRSRALALAARNCARDVYLESRS